MPKRRTRVRQRKNDFLYYLLRGLVALGGVLPRRVGLRVFGGVGRLLYAVPTPDRRRALEHLRMALGERPGGMSPARMAKRVYREVARNLFDALYLSRCSRSRFDRIVTHDDLGPFRQAYERGKGVLVITAHLGCFEMLLHFFARKGFASFAIGRRAFDPRVDRLIAELRSGPNIEYLDRSGSGRKVLRRLREGKAMGVLVDQDTPHVDGVFAHFLGRLAYTPSAPVRIAMRQGVPVFVVLTARRGGNRHHVRLHGPLSLENSGNYDRDLALNVERINELIGQAIRRDPEQWVWMHRRWRHSPRDRRFVNAPNVENYL
jgi:KDO2-lipid IV(A) lauroyltransferase